MIFSVVRMFLWSVATLVTASCVATQPAPHVETGTTPVWHGDAKDPEATTTWTKAPTYQHDPDGTYRSLGLRSFEGIEEPRMKYVVATKAAEDDEFVNITDQKDGVMRMFLRYRETWWDGDQATKRDDRQRAEVKGLGPHQKTGETFEYGTTFRTDPDFKAYGRFCHIMQVKATDGDKAPPLVTLSIKDNTHAALQYDSDKGGFQTAQEFPWKPGEWTTVRFRLTTSTAHDGALLLSVNGGEFKGVTGVEMCRPEATDYRPKWGLYRGVVPGMKDDWVEHRDAVARKISSGG